MSTKKKVVLAVSILLVLAGAVSLWLLSVSGTLCVARTGANPPGEYHTDDSTLRARAEEVRTHTVLSLARTFEPETGLFTYGLSPDGTRSSGQNDIRQLLGARVLALEAESDESLRALHEANLSAIMRDWYREEGGVGYVYVDGKSKLGGNAMLLRTLVASPHFDEYRDEARKLVLGMMALQNEDGSFMPWFKEPGYAYNADYLLTFYSGEAILALLEYAEKTGDTLAENIAVRAQEFYLGEYVLRIDENYYPAYVPWHTLSLALLFKRTGDTRYAEAIFMMTDKLLELLDRSEFVGRFYNPATPEYGTPHASSDAVYTEGLATAYAVAKKTGDAERASRYREALALAFHNLERLQFSPAWYRIFDDPESAGKLDGGIQTGVCDTRVRVDTTAHTADALHAIISALK